MATKGIRSQSLEPVNVTFRDLRGSWRCVKLRILRWHDYPGLSGLALNAVTSVLTRDRQRRFYTDRQGGSNVGVPTDLGMQMATRNRKRQVTDFPLRASGMSVALPTPSVQPADADFRLSASRTIRE